ncbi:MAG TPA: 3-deoxy-7-phosphoheptulonate synthase class II [Holophaga sp.]|nr:3-deoxy-7-phosphoheptulonate synthase class II [Holophaga sp.]
MNPWTPTSWHPFPAKQQPVYDDSALLESALEELRELPPLVVSDEVDNLRGLLGDAVAGKRFLLQGGDCAEAFHDCTGPIIADKLRVLLQMSLLITHGGRTSVIHLGRIAGQYAKPRSSDTEVVDGVELPSYRGDIINGIEATLEARKPDPIRLLKAYRCSVATLNYLRALVDGGFVDLHHPERWELSWRGPDAGHYSEILNLVQDSLHFVESLSGQSQTLRTGDIFTSHEALHLNYEEAMTRYVEEREAWYNLGAHFLWLGERTRQLDGAHMEYLRGIANPLGVKVGPKMTPDELKRTLEILDPDRAPGRITLITRFGVGRAGDLLGPLLEAVRETGHPVLWSCDPMHGNGRQTPSGIKTRAFEDILQELREVMITHWSLGSRIGAVHFELTGTPVTECLGGAECLDEKDLERAYQSGCDPRLNRNQSLEMASLIAAMLREEAAMQRARRAGNL